MSELNFEASEHHWDLDRFAMLFDAYDGENRVLCMISGEALMDHFGARPPRERIEAAFVANRTEIQEKAREFYSKGALNTDGRVLLRSVDFNYRNDLATTRN
jgi:hypothetical protein